MDYNRIPRIVLVAVLCLLMVSSAGIVAAQQTFSDDFEDGDVDGWNNPVDGESSREISQNSTNGEYSLHTGADMLSQQDQPAVSWNDGPTLDLNESFVVNGTVKVYNPGDTQSAIQIGIAGQDQSEEGENAFLIFDLAGGETFISTSDVEGSGGDDTKYNTAFNDVWVNFEIRSSSENGTLEAKVWEVGNAEPDTSISRDGFDAINGEFAVNPGFTENNRQIWLDDVKIEGTEQPTPENESLNIDTRLYLEHGQSTGYEVIYESGNESNGTLERTDVTDDTTVSSEDTNVITVDQQANEIIATNDTSVNGRTFILAEYSTGGETYTARHNVTVANATVDNMEILPTWTRVSASLGDQTLQLIIVATMIGAAAALFASSFAGLSASTGVVVLGWFAGMANDGVLIVAFMMAIFIGLNLAGNINMQVRQ